MRGKVLLLLDAGVVVGITPAYAGKRVRDSFCKDIRWDHPRVCGEKLRKQAVSIRELGSPPRMRGKGSARPCWRSRCRITPAYAGKRISRSSAVSGSGDHPRVCGEKVLIWAGAVGRWGSPPRMRGKVKGIKLFLRCAGITPAYAGKSVTMSQRRGAPGITPAYAGKRPAS